MALYGNLESVSINRFFDLGKANGGFFITSYVANESEENNLQRCFELRQRIHDKGLAYIPVFCGNKEDNTLIAGKCCFFVINKKKNSIYDDVYLTSDVLFKFAIDLCNEFGQQYFIFLDDGEVKSISKSGRAVGLFSPNVMFSNIVSSVFPFSFDANDNDDYFIKSFEKLGKESAFSVTGDFFLSRDEISRCVEHNTEAV